VTAPPIVFLSIGLADFAPLEELRGSNPKSRGPEAGQITFYPPRPTPPLILPQRGITCQEKKRKKNKKKSPLMYFYYTLERNFLT